MHAHGSSIWALILPAGQKMAANNAQIAQNRNLLFIIQIIVIHIPRTPNGVRKTAIRHFFLPSPADLTACPLTPNS
jgi:hypothetical protein